MWLECFRGMRAHLRPGQRASGSEELPSLVLIEGALRHGFRLGGIELGRLVEVVGEKTLGGLLLFPGAEIHGEFGLGRSPGGMKERG